jgi:hypothetical protein
MTAPLPGTVKVTDAAKGGPIADRVYDAVKAKTAK